MALTGMEMTVVRQEETNGRPDERHENKRGQGGLSLLM